VRTSLNLSGIFRALGIRDDRQAVDAVDLLQPVVVYGDYSRLGPSVLPPTSEFGRNFGAFAGDRAFAQIHAPPEGCDVDWSAAVVNQTAGSRQPNSLFAWRIVAVEDDFGSRVIVPGFQTGHQPSRAVFTTGAGNVPAGPGYWPTGASGNGVLYHSHIPSNWFLEVWNVSADEGLAITFEVRDTVVQPLPDALIAATP